MGTGIIAAFIVFLILVSGIYAFLKLSKRGGKSLATDKDVYELASVGFN